MMGARSTSVATGWWDTSVAGTSGARENSPGLKADGLGSVGGPVKSRWEGNAPTDYSRRVALPETARRNDHSVAPGATDRLCGCSLKCKIACCGIDHRADRPRAPRAPRRRALLVSRLTPGPTCGRGHGSGRPGLVSTSRAPLGGPCALTPHYYLRPYRNEPPFTFQFPAS